MSARPSEVTHATWNTRAFLVLLAWPSLVGAATAQTVPSAEELVDRSIAYHDPEGRFLGRAHRLEIAETRPDGPSWRTTILVDLPGERFELVRRGEVELAGVVAHGVCEMTLDGRSEVSTEEQAQYPLGCERITRMRDYYTYLWGLPMKLRDPGTRLGEVSATIFEGQQVYALRVGYQEGVGDDTWIVYFDRQSYAMVGYRFYHDEAKGDGEVIVLTGEVAMAGLRLPANRAWTTHQEQRYLATDRLQSIVALDEARAAPSGDDLGEP